VFFFQLPALPEFVLRLGNFALIDRALRTGPATQSTFSDEDICRYKEAIARPGALTAAVNYYRAAIRQLGRVKKSIRPIAAPTLLVWGDRDRFLTRRLTTGLEQWVARLCVEHIVEAGHWVQNEAPHRVNQLLIDFLRREPSS
jgi:pimeloyl-ACP methyl ester carboxylesterase